MGVEEGNPNGTRFHGIGPGAIDEVLPHDGSSGDFGTVAPHVVLHGATPPWERDATGTGPGVPWLAVLVCRAAEPRAGAGAGRRGGGASPWRVLEMTRDTFTEVIAPLDDLPSLIESADASGGLADRYGSPPDPDTSGTARIRVRAHRAPRTAGSYVAHLVSLQDCGPYFASAHGAPRERTVRLASLHSWSFRHLPSGATESP
ncbi:hypothetical protein SAVIM338S_04970 [Streptomyces avidinii]